MSPPGGDDTEKFTLLDVELDHRARTTCCKISENAHILSNEPSLACYRLQEHVRKSLAPIAERRIQMNDARKGLQGKCYDLEYSISAVRSFQQSGQYLSNVQDLMKNAIFMKQQLLHSEAQKKPRARQKGVEDASFLWVLRSAQFVLAFWLEQLVICGIGHQIFSRVSPVHVVISEETADSIRLVFTIVESSDCFAY